MVQVFNDMYRKLYTWPLNAIGSTNMPNTLSLLPDTLLINKKSDFSKAALQNEVFAKHGWLIHEILAPVSIKANVLSFETETLMVFFSNSFFKVDISTIWSWFYTALLVDCLPLCPLLDNPWAGSNPYLFKLKALSIKCSLQIGLMCPFLPHLSQYLSLAQ